ncbi:unnamed protein product [Caenorhabditis angaria]|uniref:Uncharacterized protein n=1 Tax=Caenorhabditis angaria TaxID=860376 RepID=A0A9P1IWA4_9PELO|nr:unnamed protein product [Caenorhabditis angaria]
MRFLIVLISFIFLIISSTFAQVSDDDSYFMRLQKSSNPMMKFVNPFPYHNPSFHLREENRRKFSPF